VKQGKSLDEVLAAKPTAQYDAKFGDPAQFVNRSYTSIKRNMAN
jgi:hypothetical protein